MTVVAFLALIVFSGCVATARPTGCAELAMPEPLLTGKSLDRCVEQVLLDELQGGARYSLDVRAGTRDVIVGRRMSEFQPLLSRVAEMEPRGDDMSAISIAYALDALTLLRAPNAVMLNVHHLQAGTPLSILAAAITNLTFSGDITAVGKVATVAETVPINDRSAYVIMAALRYLSTAKYVSAPICQRVAAFAAYSRACSPRCDPGSVTRYNDAVSEYRAMSGCKDE